MLEAERKRLARVRDRAKLARIENLFGRPGLPELYGLDDRQIELLNALLVGATGHFWNIFRPQILLEVEDIKADGTYTDDDEREQELYKRIIDIAQNPQKYRDKKQYAEIVAFYAFLGLALIDCQSIAQTYFPPSGPFPILDKETGEGGLAMNIDELRGMAQRLKEACDLYELRGELPPWEKINREMTERINREAEQKREAKKAGQKTRRKETKK